MEVAMRAAQLIEYGAPYEIREIDTPEPGPGEALIKIGGSGACHSDLHLMSGEIPMLPALPWTLGHENAGWVEALGPGATGVDLGDAVAVYGGWGCGRCRFCLQGDEQVCNVMLWGGIGRPGGYAEYLLVPSTRLLVPIGDLEPAMAAPLTDAGLTPYRAVKRAVPRLTPGTTSVVIGVGGLGHYGLQFLKEMTASVVVAIDTDPAKRQLAERLGADATIDPAEGDPIARVQDLTGGEGAAAVFDFVGVDATLAQAAGMVGRQGLLTIIGLAGGTLPFSFLGVAGEAEVMGSTWGSHNELREVIALAQAGKLADTTETHPLDDINQVFEALEAGHIQGRAVLVP
jgi:propanol-preferring alcohol dehydrogenase